MSRTKREERLKQSTSCGRCALASNLAASSRRKSICRKCRKHGRSGDGNTLSSSKLRDSNGLLLLLLLLLPLASASASSARRIRRSLCNCAQIGGEGNEKESQLATVGRVARRPRRMR